ncbi:MAG: DUF4013 domain-containing protein [Anaerolineae bacterium]
MDVGKSFSYVFEDEHWLTKVLIGGLFTLASFVLVGIPFIMGYFVETVRNVISGKEKPLPEWDNLGEKFKEGLILTVIFLVWAIPIWILACFQVAVSAIAGNSSSAGTIVAGLSCFTSALSILWSIVIALFEPAIVTRFALNPEFSSGFAFNELWRFTVDNIGNVIIAVLLSIVASFLGGLGVILCGVGVFLTYFWAYLVMAHLFAQVYLHRKGGISEVPTANF